MIENVTGSLVEFMNLIRDNEIMKYIYINGTNITNMKNINRY